MASIDHIPEVDNPSSFFLGPMGDPDPTEVIIAESSRILFKLSAMDPQDFEETDPPTVSLSNKPSVYNIWCPDARLGCGAPTLKKLMKKKLEDADDQPLINLKCKGTNTPQGTTKKPKVEESFKALVEEVATEDISLEKAHSHSTSPDISEKDVDAVSDHSLAITSDNPTTTLSSDVPALEVPLVEQEQSLSHVVPFALDDYVEEDITLPWRAT